MRTESDIRKRVLEEAAERALVLLAPAKKKEKIRNALKNQREARPGALALLKAGATMLASDIPVAIVDRFAFALNLAILLMLSVAFRGFPQRDIAIVLAAAVGGTILFSIYQKDEPTPLDSFAGAAFSMTSAVAALAFFGTMGHPLSTGPLVKLEFGGVIGIFMIGLANVQPQRFLKDKKPIDVLYYWALGLNILFAFLWYEVLLPHSPHFDSEPLNFMFSGGPILIAAFVFATNDRDKGWWKRTTNRVQRTLLDTDEQRKVDLEQRRSYLVAFRSPLFEILMLGLVAGRSILMMNWAPAALQFEARANALAALLMILIWGYFRRANLRADKLLLAEIREIEYRQALAAQVAVEPIQPEAPEEKTKADDETNPDPPAV